MYSGKIKGGPPLASRLGIFWLFQILILKLISLSCKIRKKSFKNVQLYKVKDFKVKGGWPSLTTYFHRVAIEHTRAAQHWRSFLRQLSSASTLRRAKPLSWARPLENFTNAPYLALMLKRRLPDWLKKLVNDLFYLRMDGQKVASYAKFFDPKGVKISE